MIWQGTEYDYDIDKVTIEELREVKRKLGLTLRGLMEGIEQLDPDAMTALYWLVMRSDGQHDSLVLSDKLQFPPLEFMDAWATSAAAAKQAEADPTNGGSRPDTATPPPNGSSTATSGTSAASTFSSSPVSAG